MPACRTQLAEYRSVAAGLALSVPQAAPPPELRDRILAAVESVVTARRPSRPPSRARAGRGGRASPPFAVPALAVVVVALGIWNISLRSDVNDAAVRAVDPVTNVGNVVSYSGGHAALFGSLQQAAPGHVYEAWVIPKGADGARNRPARSAAATSCRSR